MDIKQFGRVTAGIAKTLNYYFEEEGPKMVVRETIRFIDDNFRMQGWQGASFQPWAPIRRNGRILIKTGQLRKGFNYENRGKGEVYFYNNVPYARVHNEGFKGAVTVRAHSRNKTLSANIYSIKSHKRRTIRVETGEISKVNEFTRNVNIIQRQFSPTKDSGSPVLIEAITRELERDIRNILTF